MEPWWAYRRLHSKTQNLPSVNFWTLLYELPCLTPVCFKGNAARLPYWGHGFIRTLMFLLIHMSIISYFFRLWGPGNMNLLPSVNEELQIDDDCLQKTFVGVVALRLGIYLLLDVPYQLQLSWLPVWWISLRRLGVNVVFTFHFMALLREDRKGLSLGTDILCWDTPRSHRQDLIFTFSQRGREGKQRILTSTATNG